MATHQSRKIAFVLASSDHGTMIVNRFDYHMIDANRGFGVGFDLLNTSTFDPASVAMTTSLLALEIVLVAPLPYLLLLGLTRYIRALAYQQSASEFRRELLEFKAFEVALFIAIIAAALVERILRDRLDWQFSVAVVPVLAVLAAYYYIIENACNEAESPES